MRRPSQSHSYEQMKRASDSECPALAVRLARRHLARFPDDFLAWHFLGERLVDLARYEEAEQAFGKLLEYLPPEKKWRASYSMGRLFREAGNYERSIEWYRKAIDAEPDEATSYIFLGAVLAKQGRLLEAQEVHRTATQCPRGCIDEAWHNLGLILRAREDFDEAAQCFREAIRLDPDYREAKRALRDVERCLRLKRDK